MQQLSKGHFLDIALVEEIDAENAELARKHGLDEESIKKKKAAAKAAKRAGRKKWFGINFEFRVGSVQLKFGN